MQNRIIALLIMFVVLFSLPGFSQTAEKSEHPLLDKYYPQKQHDDTNKTITNQIKPVPQTKPSSTVTNIAGLKTKPVAITTTIPADTLTTIPGVTTTTVPSVTTTSSVTTTPDVTTIAAPTTTPVVNKPDTVTARIPVQEKVQPQRAPSHPYIDTRLGSSTQQYDTWEKNSNGAGSVTTSPK
jgi:hypothetical protein